MKTKRVIKIVFALVLTLVAVQFLNKNVFVANSPQIKPDVGTTLFAMVGDTVDTTTATFARLFNGFSSQTVQQKLANIPLQKISTGVYAKESGNNSYVEFRGNEISWKEYTVIVNGKPMVVKVPDGTDPPSSQDLAEFLK